DHRGLPLALISTEGATAWCAEYDEWGNLLNEENPHQLQQLIRLPGQQYDEESGLCVFRSIRSRIGIEVRSAIRIHSINRELNFFYRFLTRFFAAFH
ncbi:RHS domain-containing protein, partial [Escherichia coli]